jgi:hypothetical protein
VEYANSPEANPFPHVLFDQGRGIGATVGYAHFDGSQKHSTLLMDLALGKIDFIEVFQFGVLPFHGRGACARVLAPASGQDRDRDEREGGGRDQGAGPLTFRVPMRESSWIAARAAAARVEDEPEIRAHTNPVYCLRDGRPVALTEAREAVRKQWAMQAAYYRNPELPLNPEQRRELLRKVEEAEARLR